MVYCRQASLRRFTLFQTSPFKSTQMMWGTSRVVLLLDRTISIASTRSTLCVQDRVSTYSAPAWKSQPISILLLYVGWERHRDGLIFYLYAGAPILWLPFPQASTELYEICLSRWAVGDKHSIRLCHSHCESLVEREHLWPHEESRNTKTMQTKNERHCSDTLM